MKIKRSPNQVSILLVGLSGAGKSSTVNYMFETHIADTSELRSETRSTTEYTVQLNSKYLRNPDLKLSIIDTPGFGDTDGLEQDAKNIMSIKYFMESHPNIKNHYPNLVMIVLNIMENRIEGESSNFFKMLKAVINLNVIDRCNPNVVIVLSHATSIARNPKRWEERVNMKKAQVLDIVKVHLGMCPEIVVQENRPEDNDLEHHGDAYLLPNGDNQPTILHQACERVFTNAKDILGNIAFSIYFTLSIVGKDRNFRKGQVVSSSPVKKEDAESMKMSLILSYKLYSRKAEWMSLPTNEKQLQDLFRKGKLHPAMQMADSAMKMKRSPNQVFILLVGVRGAGKSSLVNYMFEKHVADTGILRSKTHNTTEYTIHVKSNEYGIPDLKLSIIDTHGFGDGLEQDAQNIMSIRDFMEYHPYINKTYPNLVMIVLNIDDNRLEEESSNFVKMLKGISNINVVDRCNQNVVVVLTFATSIGRNPKRWKERVEMKKAHAKAIVNVHLGINPEVVVQENQPEDNDLERHGDWYVLPNGDKQPKILYQACKRILKRSNDEIGHEAVAVGLRPGSDKNVSTGMVLKF